MEYQSIFRESERRARITLRVSLTHQGSVMATYREIYSASLSDPNEFWAEIGEGLEWESRWDRVLDDSRPPFYRWYTGGRLNTCHNVLDRHVENGRGDQAALIYDSPVTDTVETFSYGELRDVVA